MSLGGGNLFSSFDDHVSVVVVVSLVFFFFEEPEVTWRQETNNVWELKRMPTVSFSWMNQNEPCVNSKKSSKKAVSSISIFSITMHTVPV